LICVEATPRLRLTVQAHHLQKAGNGPEEYEDAYAIDSAAGRFAIADGASDSYDSGRWSRLLVDAFMTDAPPADPAGVRAWLAAPARAWGAALDGAALPWNHQAKARLGAHCTFLGVEIDRAGPRSAGAVAGGAWRALAIGDACLFQVRAGILRAAFPLESTTAFGTSPALLTTNPAYRGAGVDHLATAKGDLRCGDTLILATDALAQWFLRRYEQGGEPWCDLPSGADFPAFVAAERAQHRLRNDDLTLLVVSFTADVALVPTTTAIVATRDADRWRRWPC
jgi:hypothetical protein